MNIRAKLTLLLAATLTASLGLNLGLAMTVRRARQAADRPGPPAREATWRRDSIRERLDLTPEQAETLERERRQMRELTAPLWREMRDNRRALMEEARREAPEKEAIERLVGENARLYAEVERLAAYQIIRTRQSLDREQWEKIETYLRRENGSRRQGAWQRGERNDQGRAGEPAREAERIRVEGRLAGRAGEWFLEAGEMKYRLEIEPGTLGAGLLRDPEGAGKVTVIGSPAGTDEEGRTVISVHAIASRAGEHPAREAGNGRRPDRR